MQIKKALAYVRTRQQFCGHVHFGVVEMSADVLSTSTDKNIVDIVKRIGVAKDIYQEIEHSIEESRAKMENQAKDLVSKKNSGKV